MTAAHGDAHGGGYACGGTDGGRAATSDGEGDRGTAVAATAERRSPSSSWGVGPWPISTNAPPRRRAASFRGRPRPESFRRARARPLITRWAAGEVRPRRLWPGSFGRAGVRRWRVRVKAHGNGRWSWRAGLFRKAGR
jgi:hypothetical protein